MEEGGGQKNEKNKKQKQNNEKTGQLKDHNILSIECLERKVTIQI